LESVSIAHLNGLGKFSDPTRAIGGTTLFRELIRHVGVNVFDFDIPELSVGEGRLGRIRDSAGLRPLPFIPYPDTPWGKKAIDGIGVAGDRWDVASALHAMLSLENRFAFRSFLRRFPRIRRMLVALLMRMGKHSARGALAQTRFESRTAVMSRRASPRNETPSS
jgi:hypothetical protein